MNFNFPALRNRISSKEILLFVMLLFLVLSTSYYYIAFGSIKKILAIDFISLISVAVCYLFAKKNSKSQPDSHLIADRAFPIIILTMGTLSCFFFPAGSIPDEPHHFYDSYSYYMTATLNDFESIRAEDAALFDENGMISKDISEARWSYVEQHILDSSLSGNRSISSLSCDQGTISPVDLISDLPQQKLPSALGIGVAEALSLNHVWVFYFGRLFNMLFSAALIIAAVRITRIGRNAMMVVALFPMTLQLLGSYSYDAPTIGLAFLSTALLTVLFFDAEKITSRQIWIFLLITFLLAPCKVVYSLISLLALFIPKKRFGSVKQSILFKCALLVAFLAAILLLKIGKIISLGAAAPPSTLDTRNDTELGIFWSVSDILSNPLHSFVFFWQTLETYGAFWLLNIPGDSLGWFQANTSLPDFVPIAFLIIYVISSIASRDDNYVAPSAFRFAGGFSIVISSLGIILSMWLGWTFLTDAVIQGVQGRYFIPLLPLLAIVLRTNSIECSSNIAYPLLSTVSVLSTSSLIYISAVAV